MREWFESLAPRERLLVIAAGCVLGAGLFFLLVWEPLGNAVQDARERSVNQRELVAWLGDISGEARRLRAQSQRGGSNKGRNQSLLSVVDQTSRDAGLDKAVRRIQPEGNDQTVVTLEAAGFNKMLFWLNELGRDYGVRVTALTITQGEKNGEVQARLKLQRDTA